MQEGGIFPSQFLEPSGMAWVAISKPNVWWLFFSPECRVVKSTSYTKIASSSRRSTTKSPGPSRRSKSPASTSSGKAAQETASSLTQDEQRVCEARAGGFLLGVDFSDKFRTWWSG